eukprot:4462956-Amphidinium_carterae.1
MAHSSDAASWNLRTTNPSASEQNVEPTRIALSLSPARFYTGLFAESRDKGDVKEHYHRLRISCFYTLKA